MKSNDDYNKLILDICKAVSDNSCVYYTDNIKDVKRLIMDFYGYKNVITMLKIHINCLNINDVICLQLLPIYHLKKASVNKWISLLTDAGFLVKKCKSEYIINSYIPEDIKLVDLSTVKQRVMLKRINKLRDII